jgi:hypothetical protein
MFQTKVVEKIKTDILCWVTLFFENCTVYEIMWRNIVELGRPQMTISLMRIACWIPKTTRTHIVCVIPIVFLLQQWLLDCSSKLRYAHLVCLVPYVAHEGDKRNCSSIQHNTLSRNMVTIAENLYDFGRCPIRTPVGRLVDPTAHYVASLPWCSVQHARAVLCGEWVSCSIYLISKSSHLLECSSSCTWNPAMSSEILTTSFSVIQLRFAVP